MLLKNKNAVIYGAGGSIGGVVARAFAREGAAVFLTGRTLASLNAVAEDISASGGRAEIAIVDALDEKAVDKHLAGIVNNAGSIDISFNVIGLEDVQGIPLAEMSLEDFTRPIFISMQTQFITAKAAAKYMIKQGRGVILSLTATPSAKAYALTGGFGPACNAMEGFVRNLAAELGPLGIRVVCMRSAGSPDSAVFVKAMAEEKKLAKSAITDIANDTMLKRLPAMAEIASVATFLVSDMASAMTGTVANVTCGTTMD